MLITCKLHYLMKYLCCFPAVLKILTINKILKKKYYIEGPIKTLPNTKIYCFNLYITTKYLRRLKMVFTMISFETILIN